MYSPERRHSFVARSWGPSGAWWLRNRVENRVEVLLNHSLQSAVEEGGKVRLTLGSPKGPKEVTTDEIVSATGFKTDLSRLGYLDPELTRSIALEGNAVALSRRFETSVPGLFLVGIATAPTFGPVMRFMFGAKHAAPAIARRVKNAR
jgi:thioredoxin reductase